jgi:hypothetical protein
MVALAAVVQAEAKGSLSGNDYTEIQMLYARYNYAFDSSNPEMYGGVFTTDGEFVIGDAFFGAERKSAHWLRAGAL